MSDKLQEFQQKADKFLSEQKLGELISKCTEIIQSETDEEIKTLAYKYRGNAYTKKDKYARAIEDYTEAINMELKAACEGEYDRAIEDCTKLINIEPNAEAYRNRARAYAIVGEYGRAIEDYTKSINIEPNAEAYYDRAQVYVRKGEYGRAVEDYTKSINIEPNAEAYYDRAQVYVRKGEYGRAIEDYTKSINIEPNAGAYYDRAQVYVRKGEYGRAIEDYTKLINMKPENAEAYRNRARACAEKGEYNRAIEDYTAAINIELSSDIEFFLLIGTDQYEEYDRVIEDCTEIINMAQGDADAYINRARAHNSRGRAYAIKREYDRAIEDCTESINISPSAEAYRHRGMAYVRKGEHDRAIEDCTESINISPSAEAYRHRGMAYVRKGEHDRAIEDCTESINISPSAEAYRHRGMAYVRKGEHDRAIEDYTELINMAQEDADAYINRARAYNSRGDAYVRKGEYDRAIEDYTKLINIEPENAEAYYARGGAYFRKGEYDRAIEDYTKLINIEPENAEAYYNRGSAYVRKEEYDSAILNYTELLMNIKPEEPEEDAEVYRHRGIAYYARGGAYARKGEYDRAIEDYTEALNMNLNAEVYNNRGSVLYSRIWDELFLTYDARGDAYVRKGEYDRAIEDYTKLINIGPEADEYRGRRGIVYAIKGEYDRAIEDYTELINIEPEDANAYRNRGVVYAIKGEYDRAIEDYTELINMEPEDAEAYRHRGKAYTEKGDYDRAVQDFNEAIKLARTDLIASYAYYGRGSTYLFKQNYDKAFQDLIKVASCNEVIESTNLLVYITLRIKDITSNREKQVKLFELFVKLREKIKGIREKLFCKPEDKDEIAHYTSLYTLKSLAEGKTFRLYNAAYMNNTQESNIFFEIMKDKIGVDVEKKFYKGNAEDSHPSPAYIGSFVEVTPPKPEKNEDKDNLLLWCMYGKHEIQEATGACLIFKKGQFAKEVSSVIGAMPQLQGCGIAQNIHIISPYGYRTVCVMSQLQRCEIAASEQKPLPELYKVIYKSEIEGDVLKALKNLVFPLKNIWKFYCNNRVENRKLIIRLVQDMLDSIRFLFKADHYKEEQEVRVVQMSYYVDNEEQNDRKVDAEQIPPRFYLEMPSNILPSEVILGPKSSNMSEWKQRLKEKVTKKVKKSEVKFGDND